MERIMPDRMECINCGESPHDMEQYNLYAFDSRKNVDWLNTDLTPFGVFVCDKCYKARYRKKRKEMFIYSFLFFASAFSYQQFYSHSKTIFTAILAIIGAAFIHNYLNPKRSGFYVARLFKKEILRKTVAARFGDVTDENDPRYRKHFSR